MCKKFPEHPAVVYCYCAVPECCDCYDLFQVHRHAPHPRCTILAALIRLLRKHRRHGVCITLLGKLYSSRCVLRYCFVPYLVSEGCASFTRSLGRECAARSKTNNHAVSRSQTH